MDTEKELTAFVIYQGAPGCLSSSIGLNVHIFNHAGLVPRLLNAPPQLVARAAANVSGVAARLLELKTAFPQVC
jgi:hypothetical protein